MQKDRLHNTEDCRVRAYSQGQGQNCDDRKGRRPKELPRAVANISDETLHAFLLPIYLQEKRHVSLQIRCSDLLAFQCKESSVVEIRCSILKLRVRNRTERQSSLSCLSPLRFQTTKTALMMGW
jgi:hypothetical protein